MTPLVLVHGFLGGSAQWDCLRPHLAGTAEMIVVDLPGFGENAHLPVIDRIEDFAGWVIADLRAKGVDRYHLLGHSMGGMVAQEMVVQDASQIDRLVLYATGANGVIPGRFETIEESQARATADGAPKTAERIAATWFLQRQASQAFRGCADIAQLATLPAILAGLDAMKHWSGAAKLGKIEKECLVLWGDCDRTYDWQQINQLWTSIPRSNLAVVPQSAHAVHLEKTELFSRLLLDFLQQPDGHMP